MATSFCIHVWVKWASRRRSRPATRTRLRGGSSGTTGAGDVGDDDDSGGMLTNELCLVAFKAAPPTTVGLWFAPVAAQKEA